MRKTTKTNYIKLNINFTDKQKEKIATAYQNNQKASIYLTPDDLDGNGVFYFTQQQITRIKKAFNNGKCVNINLTKKQIGYNLQHGGFLGALARIGAMALPKLLPIVKPLGKALGLGAAGAAGDKLARKIMGNGAPQSGDGLYLVKEGHGLRLETDGSGLFLLPAAAGLAALLGNAFKGDGLYLVQNGNVQHGGFLMGLLPGAIGGIAKLIS